MFEWLMRFLETKTMAVLCAQEGLVVGKMQHPQSVSIILDDCSDVVIHHYRS